MDGNLTYHQQLLERCLVLLNMNLPRRAVVMGELGTEEAVDEMLLYILDHPDLDQAELYSAALEIADRLQSGPTE